MRTLTEALDELKARPKIVSIYLASLDCNCHLRVPTLDDRDRLDLALAGSPGSGARAWILRNLLVAEDGSPIFPSGAEIGGLPIAELEPIIDRALEMLSVTRKAVDNAGKG